MNKLSISILLIILGIFNACGFKTETKETQKVSNSSTSDPSKPAQPSPEGKSIDPMFSIAHRRIIESIAIEIAKDISAGQLVVSGILSDIKPEDHEAEMILFGNEKTAFNTRSLSDAEVDMANSVFSQQTFINIGCKDISPKAIAGLKEVKTKVDTRTGFYHVHAKKVFVCTTTGGGSQAKGALVTAEELYLSGSRSTFSKAGGLVSLTTKVLKLFGDNSINTYSKVNGELQPGAPIFLNVLEKIEGSGKLYINK